VAERIRAMVGDEPFDLGNGTRLRKTCSVGFASFPYLPRKPDAVRWAEVVDLADQALYIAKQAGRNTWVGFSSPAELEQPGIYRMLCDDRAGALAQGLLQIARPADA
jgi:predicted signal transduction protein with EAL and GGDEF domain